MKKFFVKYLSTLEKDYKDELMSLDDQLRKQVISDLGNGKAKKEAQMYFAWIVFSIFVGIFCSFSPEINKFQLVITLLIGIPITSKLGCHYYCIHNAIHSFSKE